MDDVDLGSVSGMGVLDLSEQSHHNSASVPRYAMDIACAEASVGAISVTLVWSCYWHGQKVIGMHNCPSISLLPEITQLPPGASATPSSSSFVDIALPDRPAVDFLSVGLIHASHMSLNPDKHANNDDKDLLTSNISTSSPSKSRAWVPVTVRITLSGATPPSLQRLYSLPYRRYVLLFTCTNPIAHETQVELRSLSNRTIVAAVEVVDRKSRAALLSGKQYLPPLILSLFSSIHNQHKNEP